MNAPPLDLATLLGDYPVTRALRQGALASASVRLLFADVARPATAFKRVVREQAFDVAELAIITFLIARAHGKPLVLLPAVVLARDQHPYLVYDASRGPLAPADVAGKRIGIRSYSVTTVTWLRGVLAETYGVRPETVRWVSFEEPHVAEFRDPPNVERAPTGATAVDMLLAGELDAAVLADPKLPDPRLARLIPDAEATGAEWQRRHAAVQINHMVTVHARLCSARPDAVREVYRLLRESRAAAAAAGHDLAAYPFGVAAVRRSLEVALDYATRQALLPRPLTVDALFDDLTRTFES